MTAAASSPQVTIVGAGAIGTLFAGLLEHGGLAVSLLEKDPHIVEHIRSRGVRVAGASGEWQTRPDIATDAAELPPADLVIVCVKAYDTAAAIAQHPVLWQSDAPVLSLQNGVGNLETLAERLGETRVWGATTTHGATWLEPGVVRHAGAGDTLLGALTSGRPDTLVAWAERLTQAGWSIEIAEDIQAALWRKLCVNVAINPFVALLGEPNGRLRDLATLHDLMRGAVTEVVAVATAQGWPLDAEAELARAWQVVEHTATNRASMLQDLDRGRRTEIDAICGAVVAAGRRLGVSTPVNDMLARLIRARETARG